MARILIVLFFSKIEENSNGEVKEIVKEVIKEEPEDEKKEEKEEEKGEGDSKVIKITVPGTTLGYNDFNQYSGSMTSGSADPYL